MATTSQTQTVMEAEPTYTTIMLRAGHESVHRRVSTTPPRDCRPDEIPLIDINGIYNDAVARKKMAAIVKHAVERSGFFYVKNHGIDEEVIENARQATIKFFEQSAEAKNRVSRAKSKHFNGYSGRGTTQISPSESLDMKESFMWQYDPKFDPEQKDAGTVPPGVKAWLRHEDFIWDGTAHIPGFQSDIITYWQMCLKLARSLAKVFALCEDLPEDYFARLTTYPGADGVLNYYPAALDDKEAADDGNDKVGIGAHTDLQCFTLLWQDEVGGLQVLNSDDEWIKAPPVPGTLVVNVGDFLMRMSNDRFKSTVHRVYNRAAVDRYSMPFFFGFNFNETCGVLPTCVDEAHPAKYEPISCGEVCLLSLRTSLLHSIVEEWVSDIFFSLQWCRSRFQASRVDKKTGSGEQAAAAVTTRVLS
ncbi:naringenin,2-oxoglutarate 3-dioxygenase [Melanomma pulvis-pyrius CBS 109.77]|uniref:Naringenin,2-oxoglutarate 3-dioxygenase n=1 Tax=Melanomma pulvis-pyrius CBS 109.77 TaxID=1314802 RepID=A0A6A6XA00_9PLEO|nr:naringenin,2-oxoglutarate 3-dioxygenase [Melanomma pulvis-pyrius CBS 109.77]